MPQVASLHDLFLHELKDLYSAETQIIKALPKMISSATNEDLKTALEEHLAVTKEQLTRLDELSEDFDFKISGHECDGMKGIITEGEKTLKDITDPAVRDVAIIGSAQRVEHYEISGYGTAVELARGMGHDHAVDLLEQTLEEESDADESLTALAKGGLFKTGINEMAMNKNEENMDDE